MAHTRWVQVGDKVPGVEMKIGSPMGGKQGLVMGDRWPCHQ